MYPKGRIEHNLTKKHNMKSEAKERNSRWSKFTPDELSSIKNALAENIYCQCDSDLLHEVENYIIWRGL